VWGVRVEFRVRVKVRVNPNPNSNPLRSVPDPCCVVQLLHGPRGAGGQAGWGGGLELHIGLRVRLKKFQHGPGRCGGVGGVTGSNSTVE